MSAFGPKNRTWVERTAVLMDIGGASSLLDMLKEDNRPAFKKASWLMEVSRNDCDSFAKTGERSCSKATENSRRRANYYSNT